MQCKKGLERSGKVKAMSNVKGKAGGNEVESIVCYECRVLVGVWQWWQVSCWTRHEGGEGRRTKGKDRSWAKESS